MIASSSAITTRTGSVTAPVGSDAQRAAARPPCGRAARPARARARAIDAPQRRRGGGAWASAWRRRLGASTSASGVSATSARSRASSASSSRNTHCSSVTASSARIRLSRSLTSMRRRWSRVRDMGARVYGGCRPCVAALIRDDRRPPRHLHDRARRAAGVASAGSSTPRSGPHVDEWEAAGHFPDALFRRCGELGFLGLHYPARWGGSDGDLAAGHRLRRGAGALPARPRSRWRSRCRPTWRHPRSPHFGTDDQRERWLRPAIAGEKIGAIAITEPDAGSDVAAIRTRAVRDGDVWRITGTKMFITNGTRAALPHARRARPRPAMPGHRGITLFIVDTSLPGVSVSRKLEKLGMRCSDTAEIALDDVAVPHADLIGGEPGQGFAQLMWQLQYERLAGAAACVGHATQVLDDTIAYARERADVRPADRRPPGDRAQARRRRDRARSRALAALLHRVARDARRVSRSPRSR